MYTNTRRTYICTQVHATYTSTYHMHTTHNNLQSHYMNTIHKNTNTIPTIQILNTIHNIHTTYMGRIRTQHTHSKHTTLRTTHKVCQFSHTHTAYTPTYIRKNCTSYMCTHVHTCTYVHNIQTHNIHTTPHTRCVWCGEFTKITLFRR